MIQQTLTNGAVREVMVLIAYVLRPPMLRYPVKQEGFYTKDSSSSDLCVYMQAGKALKNVCICRLALALIT